MPIAFGGAATGPSPGFHARAAVASCAAIGIKSAAARAGLALEQVNVRVEMDFDDRAIFWYGQQYGEADFDKTPDKPQERLF